MDRKIRPIYGTRSQRVVVAITSPSYLPRHTISSTTVDLTLSVVYIHPRRLPRLSKLQKCDYSMQQVVKEERARSTGKGAHIQIFFHRLIGLAYVVFRDLVIFSRCCIVHPIPRIPRGSPCVPHPAPSRIQPRVSPSTTSRLLSLPSRLLPPHHSPLHTTSQVIESGGYREKWTTGGGGLGIVPRSGCAPSRR